MASDPRRIVSSAGKLLVQLSALNEGQHFAMRHADTRFWGPYVMVKLNSEIVNNKAVPAIGKAIVKLELGYWTVPMTSRVLVMDITTEGLRR